MRVAVLTKEQIEEGKRLKEQGYTRKQIAELFGVGHTTVWDHIYSTKKRKHIATRPVVITFRKINIVCAAVKILRNQGLTSDEVAEKLYLPLEDVNYLWTKLL